MEEELQGPVDERIKDREASFVRVAQTSIESVQITCLGSTCKEVTCDTDEDIETCIDAKVAHSESRTICEIDFAARRSLLRYKCEKCGRECPSKHKLKRHLSTHSDARPFPCKICGRSFKWSEYLQKHMRLQHPLGKKGSIVDVPKCSLSPDKQCGVQVTGLRYASLQKEVTPSKSQDTLEEIGIYSERGCSENESMEDCEFSSGKEKSDTAGDTEKEQSALPSKQSVCVGVNMDVSLLEQSNVFPLKQSVCVGVDMDAEEEIQKTTDEIYEVVGSFAMKSAEAACPYDNSSSEVYGSSYDHSGITSNCNSHPPPLVEASQMCCTDSQGGGGGGDGTFHLAPHSHTLPANSSYMGAKTNCSSALSQCNMMTTPCNFTETVLDSNLVAQYSSDQLTPNNSTCVNLSNSTNSISSLDLISHSKTMITTDLGVQDTNLNFSSPNPFYSVDSQMEDGYSDVQNVAYTCIPGIGTLSTPVHSCGTASMPYIDVRYESAVNFRPVSHQNHDMTSSNNAAYHVASNVPDNTYNGNFTSHPRHCTMTSEYNSMSSSLLSTLPVSEQPQYVQNPLSANDIDCCNSEDVFEKEATKVDIGIQCEVGPETLQALFEDEESEESVKDLENQPTFEQSTNILESSSNATDAMCDDRLVQKFPCKVDSCNKAYIHRKDVIRHMRIRHGITPQKVEAIVVETPEKPHMCGIGSCKKSYFHMKDLRRHQRLCHKVNLSTTTNVATEEPSPEPCDLRAHMRYPCDFNGCLRSYVHKKDLVRHKRLYHKDSSSKPSIPMPIKFTDTELKQIRQKVKQEIDTVEEKKRLDSTGSNISMSNSIDEDCDTDCTILLSSSTSLQEIKSTSDLDNTTISSDVASILGALEQHSSCLFGKIN